MSTYNGERYLREQLDSLLAQRGVSVEVFVRDDGSSDGTKDILDEYAGAHGNVHVEFGENAGVGNSFMNLLYATPDTFDYYAFSDQDDIWSEEKISRAVELLQASGAILYTSNQECVDAEGNSLGMRYESGKHLHDAPLEIMSENMLSGCTMVFPNRFYRILTAVEKRPSAALLRNRIHDVWLAMVASLYNGIVYDERAFIAYRQHENNVVGAYGGGLKKRLKERSKKLFHAEYRNGRSLLAREILERFPEETARYPLLGVCARKKKGKLLRNGKELRSYTGEGRLGFFIKVMLGLF